MVELKDNEISEREFQLIAKLVREHCGINLHDGKKELVQARIAKRLRACKFDSVSAYLDHVLKDPSQAEFGHLIDALSTNLTSFYRESDHFRFLVEKALPDLLARRRKQNDSRLRFWSAGCSTGEEPYTLAMTLLDAIDDAGNWDLKILATDISTHVLGAARRGIYERERLASLPAGFAQRFCQQTVAGWSIATSVRRLIAFRHLNLMESWPFTGPFDVIFCRNVMIYFDKPTQERLVNRFYDVLSPGGVLFTGHSESLTGVKHPFEYIRPTVYGKR